MSRQTRPTTVVSQPPRFVMPSESDRLSRSHDSCTASSASVSEPSIRYATAREARCASKPWGQQLVFGHGTHSPLVFPHCNDVPAPADVTARCDSPL